MVTVTDERCVEQILPDDWRSCFDLNLVGGALLPCQEFGPAMIERGCGSIVNIASIAAHIPLSRVVAYSSAKAALVSLTQFLSREWATQGVRVNSITPGFFQPNKTVACSTKKTAHRRCARSRFFPIRLWIALVHLKSWLVLRFFSPRIRPVAL